MNESVEIANLRIETERVDDIPLLVGQMRRMELPEVLDSRMVVHGNRQGLSIGWTVVVWLAHVLSEADHRLSQVRPWAARRLETLRACTGQEMREEDLSDDRLADVLRALADDETWANVEHGLVLSLLRVYDLRPPGTRAVGAPPPYVRVDMTTARGYGQVDADGLFQFGHSKDHRPDLPQVKIALTTLDPLGLPVASEVVAGHHADDPLYRPLIKRVHDSLSVRGLLVVGDCKLAALDTRADIHAYHSFYLCPLSAVQVPPAALARALATAQSAAGGSPERIERTRPDGTREHLADGYEWTEDLSAVLDGWRTVTWTERRLLLRSRVPAAAAETALRDRLERARVAIADLTTPRRGKRCPADPAAVRQAATVIMARERVEGLLHVEVAEQVRERRVRGYRGQPARTVAQRTLTTTAPVDAAALDAAIALLGWRVYATNAPASILSLTQAALAYRGQYTVERAFGRLKGHPLSLTPLYLDRDDHTTGLIRLLTLALRVLTTAEHAVRQGLAAQERTLTGLYAGNPTRATARPTTELLLAAFRNLTLTLLTTPTATHHSLTSLTPLQADILALLGLPADTYHALVSTPHSPHPP